MGMANPDELDAQARQLRSEADALERSIGPYVRSAQGAQWEGRAATQFKSDAGSDQQFINGLANDLRSAAAALEAGANHIRSVLAAMAKQRKGPQKSIPAQLH